MINALYVVHGPAGSGKTLNQASVCRYFKIGAVIHGDPLDPVVQSIERDALIEVRTEANRFVVPPEWFTIAKTIRIFSVHQIKGILGSAWIEPENTPAVAAEPTRKPYLSPIVERRLGFDPSNCSPEQWAALVWAMATFEGMGAVIGPEKWAELQRGINVRPTRISADEPRTGDCLELAPDPGKADGRRFFFVSVDPKRVIGDPVAWRNLCKTPGSTVHLGGLPA